MARQRGYNEYIRSPEWALRRRAAYRRTAWTCEHCAGRTIKLHAHHKNYDHWQDERPEDIAVLCEDCHNEHHGGRAHPSRRDTKADRERIERKIERGFPMYGPYVGRVVRRELKLGKQKRPKHKKNRRPEPEPLRLDDPLYLRVKAMVEARNDTKLLRSAAKKEQERERAARKHRLGPKGPAKMAKKNKKHGLPDVEQASQWMRAYLDQWK